MSVADLYDDSVTLPRAVRFPVELIPPDDFDPERTETWPRLAGRLEFVEGKLLFMPPCGDLQQDTVADVVIVLGSWVRQHREYALGTNEAGMRLSGSTRAADAAIWRRSDLGAYRGGLRRVAPVLAIEVTGDDERPEAVLREKGHWYLDAGVESVWVVIPLEKRVVVLTRAGETPYSSGERLPESQALPGLAPWVDELFLQISTRGT